MADTLRSTKKTRWIALLARKHPQRYRSLLRPVVRPLSPVEVDYLLGLLAAAVAMRAKGLPRVVLLAAAANGLRRELGSVLEAARAGHEHPVGPLLLGAVVPACKAWWWLEGCIVFRRFVW